MQKVIEQLAGSKKSPYVAVFILDEAGISAASGSDFNPVWSEEPERDPAYASVFLQNVDQFDPIETIEGNSTTDGENTTQTNPLSNDPGDLLVVGGTCGRTGSYSVDNGFTEGIELDIESADGITGHKQATGTSEAASVTHSDCDKQVVVGVVINKE